MPGDGFTNELPPSPAPPPGPPAPDEDALRRRGRFDVWSVRTVGFVAFSSVGCGGLTMALTVMLLSCVLHRDWVGTTAPLLIAGVCGLTMALLVARSAIAQVRATIGKGVRVSDTPLPLPPTHVSTAAPVRPVPRLVTPHGRVDAVAISPDGRRALTAGKWGLVCLWDLETGTEIRRLLSFRGAVSAVAFSPDGRLLVAAGLRPFFTLQNHTHGVHVWDAETGHLLRELEFAEHPPSAVHVFADSRGLLVAGGQYLRLWDLEGPTPLGLVPLNEGTLSFGQARAVAVSEDERYALVALQGAREMRLYDLAAGTKSRAYQPRYWGVMTARDNEVASLAIAPNDQRAISGGLEGVARVWSLNTSQEIQRFDGHAGWFGWRGVVGVAWLDNTNAVSVSENGLLFVWETTTGRELARYEHGGRVLCLATTRDGRLAVTGGRDGVARVWELE